MRRILAAVALVACSAPQEPPPCDAASYMVIAATCGDDEWICEQKIDERRKFCAERILGER